MNKANYIVIHHSAVKDTGDQFKGINNYHKEQNFPISSLGNYVGYQVLITGGKLYRTRIDEEIGSHTNQIINGKSVNEQSLGICVGFNGDIELPSTIHLNLLKQQVIDWQRKFNIPRERIVGHRFFAPKSCPGNLFTNQIIESLGIDLEKDEVLKLSLMQKIRQLTEQIANLLKGRSK